MIKGTFIACGVTSLLLVINNYLFIDLPQGCFIKILPSWDFQNNASQIKQGLNALKYTLPDDYSTVCHTISTIDPNFDCGGFEGGCYWRGSHSRISVSTKNTTIGWISGVIVHETCHALQDKEGRQMSEAECHQADSQVMRTMNITY